MRKSSSSSPGTQGSAGTKVAVWKARAAHGACLVGQLQADVAVSYTSTSFSSSPLLVHARQAGCALEGWWAHSVRRAAKGCLRGADTHPALPPVTTTLSFQTVAVWPTRRVNGALGRGRQCALGVAGAAGADAPRGMAGAGTRDGEQTTRLPCERGLAEPGDFATVTYKSQLIFHTSPSVSVRSIVAWMRSKRKGPLWIRHALKAPSL